VIFFIYIFAYIQTTMQPLLFRYVTNVDFNVFGQINVALMSIRDFFQKHLKKILPTTDF